MAGIQLTITRQKINANLGDPGEGLSWFPRALTESGLPSGAVALMANLLTYGNNEGRSLNGIAREVGMCSRTVRRHLNILENHGWLTYTPPSPAPVNPGKRRKMSTKKALAVFDKNGYRCISCGSRKELTVDHIVPITRGGTDDMGNLQTLCRSCNAAKGNKIQEEV